MNKKHISAISFSFFIFLSSAMFLAGCGDKDKKDIDNNECGDVDYIRCADEVLSVCSGGVLYERECTGDRECRNDSCEPVGTQDCGQDFVSTCESDKSLRTCVAGMIRTVECKVACDQGECVGGSRVECDEITFQPRCDPENPSARVACIDGYEKSIPCGTNLCENGTCPGSDGICGNNRIDGSELCDNWDIGNVTCADLDEFREYPADQLYQGRPRCNETCDGFVVNTCAVTKCGDGILEEGELCDIGHDGNVIHSTFPTCDDYFNATSRGLTWKPGGEPGCNVNCDGYSKGSCQLEDQPRDGILECEFVELTEADFGSGDGSTWLQATATIKTEDSLDTNDLRGRLTCGRREFPTYNWSFKSDDYMSVVSEVPGSRDTSTVQTWLDASNWCAASFDCVFQINAKAGKDSYYNCPVVAGPPAEQTVPDDYLIRSYKIDDEQEIVGDVIAYWSFDGLGTKDDEISSAKAESGANASSAIITVTKGVNSKDTLKLLSGTCGYQNSLSISADGWSHDTSLNENDKHFVVAFNTAGFKNIHVQMHVAVSGTASGQLAATYSVSNITSTASNYRIGTDARNWDVWAFNLDGAENGNVQLNLYTYGNTDNNARLRIDELYILGDRE